MLLIVFSVSGLRLTNSHAATYKPRETTPLTGAKKNVCPALLKTKGRGKILTQRRAVKTN